ncbi:nucleotidyl transferase AbiEii/AbiGii toxin family protein [Ferrimicrobium sp.]|uniref:nucleotidyl transferase AbiEii/AbiGii toxin family protein n=1 Tax=Ferrimicrobium sp. TaxID=2926050 RepID=UPI002631E58B|nr:nucleotidyl transferase AbiEii/AbiGii toxin family protein [Ferrimicrobium sp.]
MMEPGYESMLATAKAIASQRHAAESAVVKEIMHYELLQALLEADAARSLVFQGGTALRLCYGGNRYSEDLDFAGGTAFDPVVMGEFKRRLTDNISSHYGLTVAVEERQANPDDKIAVRRWKAKVHLPRENRSLKQSHVIHLEVANIPAHTSEVRLVRPLSSTAQYSYRSLMVKTESREEILADKILALGDRPYLKHRDVWDIHMLEQAGVELDSGLVKQKIVDYHLERSVFLEKLAERIDVLQQSGTRREFAIAMAQFLDGPLQSFLKDITFLDQVFNAAVTISREAIAQLERGGGEIEA